MICMFMTGTPEGSTKTGFIEKLSKFLGKPNTKNYRVLSFLSVFGLTTASSLYEVNLFIILSANFIFSEQRAE